jgi:hypothetical protein
MIAPGDVISYPTMCSNEGTSLQKGMNFRLPNGSVLLMSTRNGAPYRDRVEDSGDTLIYEGHDQPSVRGGEDPKSLDQVGITEHGTLTENGLFFNAAKSTDTHRVKVYEKMKAGIWVFNGFFRLADAWQEEHNGRKVFKFRLTIIQSDDIAPVERPVVLDHTRMIPSHVKQTVWARDKGKCVTCGSTDNLHFDHIIPFSKGGSSLTAANIQLMCARHNLAKRARII